MSRPIAYDATQIPISGSIIGANGYIAYTTDGAGNDYPNGHGGIPSPWVPSADGAAPIVFVTDTFTQGYEGDVAQVVPLFFACAGTSSAAILYTANRLPGSPGNYVSAPTAIDDLCKNHGYFILEGNDPFEGINADSLALNVDAAKMSSYPETGTNWYDLSGYGANGTLINGPTFNSNGWIDFDGTNDYTQIVGTGFQNDVLPSSSYVDRTATFMATVKFDTTANAGAVITRWGNSLGQTWWFGRYGGGSTIHLALDTSTGYKPFFSNSGVGTDTSRFYHIAATVNGENWTIYNNGQEDGTGTYTGTWDVPPLCPVLLGAQNTGSAVLLDGKIASAKVYSRALSQTEVKQNYFGSPIVTDGLIFAVDANNIVSYPKSGTAWYNLTGSVPSASLFNSPAFTLSNGGAIDFDGSDDYATTPSTTISGDQTLCAWGMVEGPPNSPAGVITQHNYASTANFGINYVSNGGYKFGASIGYTNGTREFDTKTTNYLVQEGVIWNVVLVYSSSNNTIYWYVNGQLDSTYALSATPKSTNWPIGLGRWDPSYPAYYFTGKIFNSKIYNRALSAAEILQNYQAEQYRFEGPQGPVTNGLVVHLDALNLDSYPGTGDTWYDLSGNGNNATRNGAVGNPTWNQTNGWYFYASVNGVNGGLTIANSATIQNLTATTVFLVVAMETKTVISGDSDWMAIYSKFASDQRIAISVNQGVGYRYLHIETPGVTNSSIGTFTNADYTGTKYNIMAARVGASGTTGWLNGTQISTSAITTTGNTGAIYLGHDVNNEMFKGSMKASLTYNRALSDAEMAQMFTYLNTKFNVY